MVKRDKTANLEACGFGPRAGGKPRGAGISCLQAARSGGDSAAHLPGAPDGIPVPRGRDAGRRRVRRGARRDRTPRDRGVRRPAPAPDPAGVPRVPRHDGALGRPVPGVRAVVRDGSLPPGRRRPRLGPGAAGSRKSWRPRPRHRRPPRRQTSRKTTQARSARSARPWGGRGRWCGLNQTWAWYAAGLVLGVLILVLFAVFEKGVERLLGWSSGPAGIGDGSLPRGRRTVSRPRRRGLTFR